MGGIRLAFFVLASIFCERTTSFSGLRVLLPTRTARSPFDRVEPPSCIVKDDYSVVQTSNALDIGYESDKAYNFKIVLIAGFETFNAGLYREAAERVMKNFSNVQISVYTDRDIVDQSTLVQEALTSADVLFASLLL